ncbi:pentapeptide repeat-containing protein [Candidatus Uabimicrobium amorphum]|uniref:Low-complexity protein n=1 Tax=Uabimicrobium amorphum TaxID=2596890 RepID=A0A5S9F6C5_UABAM|nr:pentapeptide repeat-containing protein [Candidatus Uabimicrobium amorphum]BBM87241.1 hypothetical protein UABAM_05644 [Candidatus Uabimicrobium amorphum]
MNYELKEVLNQNKKNLVEVDLSGKNLFQVDLIGANLAGANLSGANLSGAYLACANLCGANLWGANLSGAHLFQVDLTWSDLTWANLSGANLSGANLSGAYLGNANLSRADLSRASLHGASLFRADLSETDLTQSLISIGQLADCNVKQCKVVDVKRKVEFVMIFHKNYRKFIPKFFRLYLFWKCLTKFMVFTNIKVISESSESAKIVFEAEGNENELALLAYSGAIKNLKVIKTIGEGGCFSPRETQQLAEDLFNIGEPNKIESYATEISESCAGELKGLLGYKRLVEAMISKNEILAFLAILKDKGHVFVEDWLMQKSLLH